jgi:hypothetical protein
MVLQRRDIDTDIESIQLLTHPNLSQPSAEYNCTIMEAIQAATALPDWFPPVTVGPTHLRELLTSGIIGYNNPTKKALEEAKRLFGSDRNASIVLSFGSGRRHPQGLRNDMKDGLRQVLDDLAQSGEDTAEELSKRFRKLQLLSPALGRFWARESVDNRMER